MTPLVHAAVVRVGGPDNARRPGSPGGSTEPRSHDAIVHDLGAARDAGARLAVLVGGEPTLRRDLPKLLRAARDLGLGVGLVTNGRTLVYPQLRQRLVAAGVVYVQVGLHGATAATHDGLVGVPGAFAQTTDGLRALLAEAPGSLRVDVACTVARSTLPELGALADLVTGWRRTASLSLRFVAPVSGLAVDEWPAADDVAETLAAALLHANGVGADVQVTWEGFPPCLLDAHAQLRDELLRYGVPAFGPDADGGALAHEATGSRSHPYPCQECLYEYTCPGAPAAFLARDGEAHLRPTKAVRANSFNYEFIRDISGFRIKAGDCSAKDLAFDGDPVRSVLLAHDDRVSLYHSPTSDFTDAELRHVKDGVQQLYVDLSAGAALFDFMTDVRRVRFHDECGGCPDRARCSAAVVVDPDPPFAREERWLRKEVSRTFGRVLDVGCGEQPYGDEIAEGIRTGRIEYHGLDPDEESLEKFRAKAVGGTLHQGTIEDFDWEDGYFDYVLAFRSLNHFHDMERAVGRIARLLRPEGMLYLCDSPPFGMLRTPKQVRYADENAPHGHEHFRNWTSHQLVDFLKRFPFRLDVHRPVNAQTSNQWLVKVMRVADPGAGK